MDIPTPELGALMNNPHVWVSGLFIFFVAAGIALVYYMGKSDVVNRE